MPPFCGPCPRRLGLPALPSAAGLPCLRARAMPTLMVQPALAFVPEGSPNSQRCAVLEKTGVLTVKWAAIPEVRAAAARPRVGRGAAAQRGSSPRAHARSLA